MNIIMSSNRVLCNDLVIVCLSFLPIKKIIKMRAISRNWTALIDKHPWDFSKYELVTYYRTIFEKRQNWFQWLNRNNIDPHFSRTNNMIAFSICYSSAEIVKWFIDNDYPLSNSYEIEIRAIQRCGRNSQKIALLQNYLKRLIHQGKREYNEWLLKLNDPQILYDAGNDYFNLLTKNKIKSK